MKRIVATAMLLAGLACGLAPATSVAADAVPGDRLLPPKVLFWMSVPNVEELKKGWNESAFGRLRNDENLAEFWEDVDAQLKEASSRIERELGLSLDDLAEIPNGELSLAVTKPTGKPIGLTAMLGFGKNRERVEKLLEKAADALDNANATRKVQEFENTRIIVYQMANFEDADGPVKPQFAYFIKDEMLVVGNEASVLESVLSRWSGDHPRTFADNSAYQYIMKRCVSSPRVKPALTYYVNPIEMVRVAVSMGAQGNPQAAMAMGFLPLLGVHKLEAMGGAMEFGVDGFDSVSRSVVYVDQPPSGLLNMFRFPETELAPPAWVGSNADNYMSMNWDVKAAYGAVESLFDSFQGPGAFARVVDDLADRENGPGFHPKKDFLDQLTGRIHVSTSTGGANRDGLQEVPQFLMAMGTKDADKMSGLLAKVSKRDGFPAESRDFRGVTIYEMSQGPASFAVSVAKDSLVMTNDVKSLERMIRGGDAQNSLVDSDNYKKIAKHFPAKTSMIGFQRQDSQVKAFYDLLRNGAVGNDSPVDFSKLPPFEKIQKYLPPTGSYVIPDENGALSVSFSLKPAS